MILYYFPIAQNTVNKTVSEKFYRGVYACIMYVHIFYYFSIYWSDTSLVHQLNGPMVASFHNQPDPFRA